MAKKQMEMWQNMKPPSTVAQRRLKGSCLPHKDIRKPETKEVAKRKLALSGCV